MILTSVKKKVWNVIIFTHTHAYIYIYIWICIYTMTNCVDEGDSNVGKRISVKIITFQTYSFTDLRIIFIQHNLSLCIFWDLWSSTVTKQIFAIFWHDKVTDPKRDLTLLVLHPRIIIELLNLFLLLLNVHTGVH